MKCEDLYDLFEDLQVLEELCARLLKAQAPGCCVKQLPSGGVDGEASVGKLLLSAAGADAKARASHGSLGSRCS